MQNLSIFHDLGMETFSQVIQSLRELPYSTIDSLDLIFANSGSRTAAELVEIFQTPPPAFSTLDLRFNDLGSRTAAELVEIFQTLPPIFTFLKLGTNNLGSKTAAELVEIFQALPPTLTTFDLSENNLGSKSADELVRICQALPPALTSLYLGGNNLSSKPADELVHICQALPSALTSLYLGGNNLSSKPADELVRICQALPTLRSICLSRYGERSAAPLAVMVQGTHITEVLGVTYNSLLSTTLRENRNRIEKVMMAMGQAAYHLGLGSEVLTAILSWLPMAASSGTATKSYRAPGKPIPQFDLKATQMALARFYSCQSLMKESYDSLQDKINELEHYGSQLLTMHQDKGNKVITLAQELNELLRSFSKKPYREQKSIFSQFKADFVNKLHSKDAASPRDDDTYASSRSLFFARAPMREAVYAIAREVDSVRHTI
jgi:hypothetical protein